MTSFSECSLKNNTIWSLNINFVVGCSLTQCCSHRLEFLFLWATNPVYWCLKVSYCLYFTTCMLIWYDTVLFYEWCFLISIILLSSVRKHQANSHAKKGWEQFTDAVIKTISQKKEGVVFLLWGNSAREKSRYCHYVTVYTKHEIVTWACNSFLDNFPMPAWKNKIRVNFHLKY